MCRAVQTLHQRAVRRPRYVTERAVYAHELPTPSRCLGTRPPDPMTEPDDRPQFTRIPAGRHGLAPADVVADQRARLHASMIILAADNGYPSTSVKDLISHAKISRRTFYELHNNREACLVASCHTLVDDWRARSTVALREATKAGPTSVRGRLHMALQALVELVQTDPRGARTLFVETLNAGSGGQQALAGASRPLEQLLDRELFPNRTGCRPSVVATAVIGGILEIVVERLRTSRTDELPGLVDPLVQWILAYHHSQAAVPFLGSLEAAAASSSAEPRTPPPATSDSFPLWRGESDRPVDLTDPYTRIVRATLQLTGERGYPALSANAIQRSARVSPQTFRRFFRNKTEAFLAAYREGNQATIDYALKAYTSAPSWPAAVRAGLAAELEFLATQPALARTGFVEVFAAGPQAIELRQQERRLFSAALQPGYSAAGKPPHAVTSEAITGAIDQLIRRFLLRHEPDKLAVLLQPATFCALAPFLGARRAARRAL